MTVRQLDYDIRKVNSVFLRVVLTLLLLYIYKINNNFFASETYIISFSIYILVLLFHHKFCGIRFRGFLRFMLDLSIITIVVYSKTLNQILNFLPYILLIFNVINHSNPNGRIFIFFSFLHLSIFVSDGFRFIETHQLIPITLYGFIFAYFLRQLFEDLNSDLNRLTADLFLKNINDNSSHRILDNVKKGISEDSLRYLISLNEIYLFRLIGDKLIVIKGTEFIKDIPILEKDEKDALIKMRYGVMKNKSILSVNNKVHENSVWFRTSIQDYEYAFLLSSDKPINFLRERAISGLAPIFNQICRLFYLSDSMDKLRRKESQIIKEKVTYVLDAKNALHYVKNKLTPITVTMDLVSRYFNRNYASEEKKRYIEQTLRNSQKNQQLKRVIDKAEVLIKGVDNLIRKEDVLISLKDVIYYVRKEWLYHFQNVDGIEIHLKSISGPRVRFNAEVFEFVFTDLIENMSKHGADYRSVSLEDNGDKGFHIYFKNDVKDFDKKYKGLKEISELYNHPENDEIYSRTTHGLSFMRRLLRRKGIINEIIIDKEHKIFIFRISFNYAAL